VRSYQTFMLGLAIVLFASVIVRATGVPRPIGCLMGLAGLAYVGQGWVLGFSAVNEALIVAGIVLMVAWSGWLVWIAWRT
jgi:hypothetical protein